MASEKPVQKKEEKKQEIGEMPVVEEANESSIITPNKIVVEKEDDEDKNKILEKELKEEKNDQMILDNIEGDEFESEKEEEKIEPI